MMKVLLVHPQNLVFEAAADQLRNAGVGVLTVEDPSEVLQVLSFHGKSVDLAIIHREGKGGIGTPGLSLVEEIFRDATQSDLPMILTSDQWNEAQAAEHQQGQFGVNAYLTAGFRADRLIGMFSEVLGVPLVPLNWAEPLAPEPSAVVGGSPLEAIHLQEVSELLDVSHQVSSSTQTEAFSLELPDATPDLVIEQPVQTDRQADPSSEAGSTQAPSWEFSEEHSVGETSEEMDSQTFHQPSESEAFSGAGSSPFVPHSADQVMLRQYLSLREQDVASLEGQLKVAKSQVQQLGEQLRVERARGIELSHAVEHLKKQVHESGDQRSSLEDQYRGELSELKFQLKVKADRIRLLELQVKEHSDISEQIQERVRVDIRRVRMREKELENRLEILRKDSEALLSARESKLVELKRKIDLLEFNMELLQTQNQKEREVSRKLREQLARVAQAVRVAGGLLQSGTVLSDVSPGDTESNDLPHAQENGNKVAG